MFAKILKETIPKAVYTHNYPYMSTINESYTALFEWLQATVPQKIILRYLSTLQIILPFKKP